MHQVCCIVSTVAQSYLIAFTILVNAAGLIFGSVQAWIEIMLKVCRGTGVMNGHKSAQYFVIEIQWIAWPDCNCIFAATFG